MQNPNEMWQAEVNGEIFDASFGELTVWIAENSLFENDKVRRGRLRWLEAGRVPQLSDFFDAKANGTEPPFVNVTKTLDIPEILTSQTTIDAIEPAQNFINEEYSPAGTDDRQQAQQIVHEDQSNDNIESEPGFMMCELHKEFHASFVCDLCSHTFCFDCIQGPGTQVTNCPYCGGMCREIKEFQDSSFDDEQYQKDMAEGFVVGDFIKALSYPLNFKISLIVGGIIFSVFSLAQIAANFGIFFAAAAIVCVMFANSMKFAVLANTVDNFSRGRLTKNFMSTFDDFELWDDVIQPFFLSIAVYLVGFGLVIAIFVGIFFIGLTNSPGGDMQVMANISDEMKSAREDGRLDEHGRVMIEDNELTPEEEDALLSGNMAKFQELKREKFESKVESIINPKQTEIKTKDYTAAFLKMNPFLIALSIFGILWGIFYTPIAYIVAGYTRSFGATLNIAIGFETINLLGVDYFKLVILFIFINIFYGLMIFGLNFIFAPLYLPQAGNIPAQLLGNFIFFYLFAVFSVTLGFALYKNSDKLKLIRRS